MRYDGNLLGDVFDCLCGNSGFHHLRPIQLHNRCGDPRRLLLSNCLLRSSKRIFMNWWQAMLTILLGNTIVLVPMVLNAHAGTKYGVSFPVLARASFGTRGANVPALLRAVVACGWFGIQTWIGGTAIDALLGVMWPGWLNLAGGASVLGVAVHTWLAFLFFWAVQVFSSRAASRASSTSKRGPRRCCWWAAPRCSRGPRGARAGWGACSKGRTANQAAQRVLGHLPRRAHGLGRLLGDAQPQHPRLHALRALAALADAGAGSGPAADDDGLRLHRRGGDERDAHNLRAGDPEPGRADRASTASPSSSSQRQSSSPRSSRRTWPPTSSRPRTIFEPQPEAISYVTGGLITAVIGIVMMPWKLMASMGDYIFTWLIGYSG